MEEPKKIVQIVFLGGYRDKVDRVKYLLRKFIPHKVYFLRNEDSLGSMVDGVDLAAEMKKEYERELPKWVADESEEVSFSFFNFEECFQRILEILVKEKRRGNEVIMNFHGATHIASAASIMCASLVDAKIFFAKPQRYELSKDKHDIRAVGVKEHVEIKIPLTPQLPKKEEGAILTFLLKQNGDFKGKLHDVVSGVGLQKLGANIKKPNSGVVKASKTLKRLREDGCIITKKISRKTFQISLTEKGKLLGGISNLIEARN